MSGILHEFQSFPSPFEFIPKPDLLPVSPSGAAQTVGWSTRVARPSHTPCGCCALSRPASEHMPRFAALEKPENR